MYVSVGEGQGIVRGRSRSGGGSRGESPWTTRAVGAAVIVAVAASSPAGKLAMKKGFCRGRWRRLWRSHPQCWSGHSLSGKSPSNKCLFFFFFLLLDAWRGKFGRKFHYSRICRENQKCFLKSVWELYPWNLLKIIVPLQCFNWEINSTRKSQFWVSVVCLHLKSKIKFFQFKGSSV